jgi:hypothetical protein
MPHRVVKRGRQWAIVRVRPNGQTTTVGHSRSKRKAQLSASIRDRADRPRGRGGK